MEGVDHLARRSRRRGDAVQGGAAHVVAQLLQRRHVRIGLQAGIAEDRQRPQRAGLDVRLRGRDRRRRHVHMAAQQGRDRRSTPLVRYVAPLHARFLGEGFGQQVRDAHRPGAGEGDLAGVLLRMLDQLAQVLPRRAGGDDQHQPTLGQGGDRRERFRRVAHFLVGQRHHDDRARRGAHQRVAVRLAGGHEAGADAAARARLVVQDDRLAQELHHPFDEGAQHVVGVARRERNDQLDGLDGEILRSSGRRRRHCENTGGGRSEAEHPLLDPHVFSFATSQSCPGTGDVGVGVGVGNRHVIRGRPARPRESATPGCMRRWWPSARRARAR